jgi:hypothetical protein
MNDAEDVEVIIRAIQTTLEWIWIALVFACLSVLSFSCVMAVIKRRGRPRSGAVVVETNSQVG